MSKKGGEDYGDEWEIVDDPARVADKQIKNITDFVAGIPQGINVEATNILLSTAQQLIRDGKTPTANEIENFKKIAVRIKSESPIFTEVQKWAASLVEFLKKDVIYEKDIEIFEKETAKSIESVKTILSTEQKFNKSLTMQDSLTNILNAGMQAGKPQLNSQSSSVAQQSPTQQQTFGGTPPPPPPPPPPPAQQNQGDITAAIRAAKEKNQSRQGESTAKKAVGGDMMSELANKLKKKTSDEMTKLDLSTKAPMTDLDRKNAEAIAKEEAERAAKNKAILEKQAKEKEARAAKEEAAAKPKEQATPTQPSQPIINTGAGAPPPPPPPPPPGMGGISTPTWKQQQEAAKLQEQTQQPVTVKKPAQ